jgi:ATP-dependent helicase HrpA
VLKTLIEETRQELDSLMPKDFVTRYSLERLKHFPRYLEALRLRIERGAYNPAKDRSKADQVSPFIQALKNLRSKIPSDSPSEQKAAIEEFRWMVEEFKVSLFAPEIKTAHSISVKRLLVKLKELQASISD